MKADPSNSRHDKVATFDPNTNGHYHQGIFGLPFDIEEAQIVILPVPWDATVSYGEGAAEGPYTIWKASQQLDLYDELRPGYWRAGYAMGALNNQWYQKNEQCRQQVRALQAGDPNIDCSSIDHACEELNQAVASAAEHYLNKGQLVGLVGGEHSVMLGYLRALKKYRQEAVGVIQLDAHCDLRVAYEGLSYSHASVMQNAITEGLIDPLVSVGIRDFAEAEVSKMQSTDTAIHAFSDSFLKQALFKGATWDKLCDQVIAKLPQQVYVSFDIDALDPALCPHTGTPVPGGISFEKARYLIHKITESGRQIIGFDLSEVAPGPQKKDEWDGNVGSRILYHLCNEAAYSHDLA
jgi:agmatinase